MKERRSRNGRKMIFAAFLALACTLFLTTTVRTQQTNPTPQTQYPSTLLQIPSGGTTYFQPTAQGSDAVQSPEFDNLDMEDDGGDAADTPLVNRSITIGPGTGATVQGGKKAKSNPEQLISFNGLNLRDQRLANGGNQFTVEPPDQGLCAGNGYVLETVNDVLNVYDAAGNSLLGATDLNTFYGYAAAINRSANPLTFGPSITDPSCYFDTDVQRWFHVVLTLNRAIPTSQALSGKNHLDIAVSQTPSPLGAWTVYRVPVQNDGTDGTPDHNCRRRVSGVLVHGPCLGDYPHIGADANGFYITTNEFYLFSPGFFTSAQIYAFSKQALASGAGSVTAVQFDTANQTLDGAPGFTVWPATTPASGYSYDANGTEYFLSSVAVFSNTATDNRIRLWSLSNTQSLGSGSPAPVLNSAAIPVVSYGVPPKFNNRGFSEQKTGPIPLGECLNDNTIATPFGTGCWRNFFISGGPFSEVESHLDSNDSRMQQVVFANGKVWGALDTIVNVGGQNKAGIAYFILKPVAALNGVSATVAMQGYVALANNNVNYPAVGVTAGGRGVIAFTLVGGDYFPTAGYVPLDAQVGAGDIRIAGLGAGPSDGFTSYRAFVGGNPPRTRWGDYGATAIDGNTIWMASEFIAQTCTLSEYLVNTAASPAFSCNKTRVSQGNWATRITRVKP